MKTVNRLVGAAVIGLFVAGSSATLADEKKVDIEGLASWKHISGGELKKLQGGTEVQDHLIVDSFDTTQSNDATLTGQNLGNKLKNNGVFNTGGATAVVTGNRGMTSVMQVTGAMNNVANNVMYNIYLK